MTYQLIDSGDFQKLEAIGPYRLVRPSPQAVWSPRLPAAEWERYDAKYTRFAGGEGKWTVRNRQLPKQWQIDVNGQIFVIKLTDFGHLGIFPEQEGNWQRLTELVAARQAMPATPFKVLNLFAYTGGSSFAAARAGAAVTHVDASKTSVSWARENAEANAWSQLPIRWLVEDAARYVERELRRGSLYQGIILDPPSFGRGPDGEVWKIEEHMVPLLNQLKQLLAPDFAFVLLSSHSAGYSPLALENLLRQVVGEAAGHFHSHEMMVMEENGQRCLPSGASCFFIRA